MAINVGVQYYGGFLPDIVLLTLCYYHRGTRLSAMKSFCRNTLLCSNLNIFTIFLPDQSGGCEGLDAFRFFFKNARRTSFCDTLGKTHKRFNYPPS